MNSNRYPLPAQTGLVVAPGLPPKNSTLRPDQLNKRLSSAGTISTTFARNC